MLKLIKGSIFNKNILLVKKEDPFPDVFESMGNMKGSLFS